MQRLCLTVFAISLLAACSADEITSHAECVADLAEEVGARKSGEASANCHVDTNEPGQGGAGGTGGASPDGSEHPTAIDAQCAGHEDFEVCKYNSGPTDPTKLYYAACFGGRCLPYANTGAENGQKGCADVSDCQESPCLEQVCHKGLCIGFWHAEDEGRACLREAGIDATCHSGSCIVDNGS